MAAVPTCVYRVDPPLIELLDERLGPPLDSYVRGWQVWLEDNGPDGVTLEWRLHPPARFRMPRGVNPHDLFDVVLQGVADLGAQASDPFAAGEERLTLAQVWEVLEVFPAYGDDVEPPRLAAAAAAALGGRRPDAVGRADHDRLGDLWKGKRGDFSVGQALLDVLEPGER
jgi:hypothetical protein